MTHGTITIFGASGKVGRLVVSDALARGYSVTAFVHTHSDFDTHPALTVIQGDVHSKSDIENALAHSTAVISTLGSWSTKQKDILTAAMSNIIPTMEAGNPKRIVSLTGADARARGDDKSLVHHFSHTVIRMMNGKILEDGENHIKLLENSSLDWTVIRAPIMNSRDSRVYMLSHKRPRPWNTVPRKAVAEALLNQLEKNSLSQQAPFIS